MHIDVPPRLQRLILVLYLVASCKRHNASKTDLHTSELNDCPSANRNSSAPRHVSIGRTSGIVLPYPDPSFWIPDDRTLCEFERGLRRDLKKRNQEFPLSDPEFPRRYLGRGAAAERQLLVYFCYNEEGWDNVEQLVDHPPWRYVMGYHPATRVYSGPVDLRTEGFALDRLE